MKRKLDPVEIEYEMAITRAMGRGDNDEAQHLVNGLKEYQAYYKVEPEPRRYREE